MAPWQFAGAADMMLLCDGEDCEEAFHSFCLKIPLQSIPEGDWLCPLCLEESKAPRTSVTKRTSRMRAKLIPPLKKVEVIVGWRGDVSDIETGTSRDRRLQYLVKWCSMSHRHDTWVSCQLKKWIEKLSRLTFASHCCCQGPQHFLQSLCLPFVLESPLSCKYFLCSP